jgi:hypothetical protein
MDGELLLYSPLMDINEILQASKLIVDLEVVLEKVQNAGRERASTMNWWMQAWWPLRRSLCKVHHLQDGNYSFLIKIEEANCQTS